MKLTKTQPEHQVAGLTESRAAEMATGAVADHPDTLAIDRRTFLRRSGLAAGAATLAGMLPMSMMQRAKAEKPASEKGETLQTRTICTHCSVGCGIIATVDKGVWTRQEPAFGRSLKHGNTLDSRPA